jgi:hypothetical protein
LIWAISALLGNGRESRDGKGIYVELVKWTGCQGREIRRQRQRESNIGKALNAEELSNAQNMGEKEIGPMDYLGRVNNDAH